MLSPSRLPVLIITVLMAATGLSACGSTSDEPAAAVVRLDPSFGRDGVAVVPFGPGYAEATDVAMDTSGRAVVAGIAPGDTGVLLRLLGDGTSDAGFGEGGRRATPFEGPARAVALGPRGDIHVAGERDGGFAVARYDETGSPDRGFGGDGVAVVGFEGFQAAAHALAVDGQGAIIAGGAVFNATDRTTQELGLVRLKPDGRLDATFGTDGRVHAFTPAVLRASAMLVDPQGRTTVAAGVERAPAGQPADSDAGFYRYTADGRPDETFGDRGAEILDLGSPFDTLNGVALVEPDRILGAGNSNPDGRGVQAAVVATDGSVAPRLPPLSEGFAAAALPDGGFAMVAKVAEDDVVSDHDWEWALAAYDADGTPDTSIGPGGVLRSAIGQKPNAVSTALDGGLVVAGCTCLFPPRGRGGPESDSSFVIARYAVGD